MQLSSLAEANFRIVNIAVLYMKKYFIHELWPCGSFSHYPAMLPSGTLPMARSQRMLLHAIIFSKHCA